MQTERLRLSKTHLRRVHAGAAVSISQCSRGPTPARCRAATSRRARAAGAVSVCLLLAFPPLGEAQETAPCAAYWDAAAVFVGRLEAVKRAGTTRVVSFTVLEGFVGVTSSTIAVTTGPAGQRCSLAFKVGREYVVYAGAGGASGEAAGGLTASGCSRTRDAEDAGADLAYARALKEARNTGIASAGHISGRVLLAPRDLAGKATGVPRPVPDITVTVTREGVEEGAVTDRAGEFRVESRGPGAYRVRVNVPERFYSDDPTATVVLRDPRSCGEVATTLQDNGLVAGRVVDATGRPIAGLTLELGVANKDQGGRRTVTGRDGRYTLARIPPGRFVVSVPVGPSRATGDRPIQILHPGVGTLAAATRVVLAPGEHRDLEDFKIPTHYNYVPVSGVVFDADGAPAEGARVYLKGVGEDDRIVSEPVAVDFMGRFVIAARAGTDYLLFAERPRGGGRSSRVDSTDELRVSAVEGLKPVRLTLERRY
jgi:hypothetical protein